MKKRMMLLLLICAMIFGAMPVYAAQPQFSVWVQAEQKDVKVGDTVYYTVIAQGEDVVALQFNLEIPEGMKFVSGSGALSKGLREKLGVAAVDWTEGSMIFTYYNDVGVTIPKDTVLMTFACVAEKAGDYQVGLVEVLPFDSNFEEFQPSVELAVVTVSEAQEQGSEPSTEPATEATDPTQETATESTEPGDTTEPTQSLPTEPEGTEATEPGNTLPEDQTQDTQPGDPETSVDTTPEDTTGNAVDQGDPLPNGTDGDKDGNLLWIVLGAAAVLVIGGVLVFFLQKKKRG